MVIESAIAVLETFPATSVATAVMESVPSVSTPVVQLNAPEPFAVQVAPVVVPPTDNWTTAPISAVPVMVGVVSFVMVSELEDPVSDAASRVRPVGVELVVSTVTLKADEAADTFPCWSVAVAVNDCVPAVRVPVVQENAPDPLAVHIDPVATPPTYN